MDIVSTCSLLAIAALSVGELCVAREPCDPLRDPKGGSILTGQEPLHESLPAKWAAKEPVPERIEALLDEMATRGRLFQPDPLLEYGMPGLRAALDRALPETAAAVDCAEEANTRWIGDHLESDRFSAGLAVYLSKLPDSACYREVAKRAVRSLNARLDKTSRREVLTVCVRALANSRDDSVHNLLLRLLKHEDPAVAIFAMRAISGRTGNSYVAPLHMGAIASGRRELVKEGFT